VNSLPQTDGRCIIGPPFIHLVDIDGHDVPRTERWEGPSGEIDPLGAAAWPAWTDNWHWCVDEQEAAQLEAEEQERLADLADAPRPGIGESAWHAMMAESLPPIAGGAPFEPSPEDWADYHRTFDEIDESGPPRDQVSDVELAMLAAGLAVG
jgi:hypothetical protein